MTTDEKLDRLTDIVAVQGRNLDSLNQVVNAPASSVVAHDNQSGREQPRQGQRSATQRGYFGPTASLWLNHTTQPESTILSESCPGQLVNAKAIGDDVGFLADGRRVTEVRANHYFGWQLTTYIRGSLRNGRRAGLAPLSKSYSGGSCSQMFVWPHCDRYVRPSLQSIYSYSLLFHAILHLNSCETHGSSWLMRSTPTGKTGGNRNGRPKQRSKCVR
jgi:hypothetical protein